MLEEKKNVEDDINDLLGELQATKNSAGCPFSNIVTKEVPKLNEVTIEEFIMDSSANVIQNGVEALQILKNNVISSGNPDEIESYSKLMASVANSIDVLNKINLQNKKIKAQKEIKQLESAENTANKSLQPTIEHQTNNILITTREQIMKALKESEVNHF